MHPALRPGGPVDPGVPPDPEQRDHSGARLGLLTPIVKGWNTELVQEITSLGVQVHGGMGYTWEVPAHYYLKRTWVLESIFGTCEEHETRIADQITAGR